MRKCIDLESHPGFEEINSPVLMQAIDRGLQGFSGTGVVDWGYDLPKPREIPVKRGGEPPVKQAPKIEPIDPNLPHKVITGGDPYWDYLFNRWASQSARKIINRFPNTKITKGGRNAGSHNSYEGPWSVINTPYGYGGLDVQVLFHEYGHALDNIIGYATGSFERDTVSRDGSPDKGRMETSLQLFGPMKADGEKLGLVFDDSAYWDFIEKYGIAYTHTRGRRLNIAKGSKRDSAEPKMKPGDHWLIMKYMVDESKKNVARIKNTKTPDPVQLKRAKEELLKITRLYDKHIARHKKVVEIIKELHKIEASMAKSMPDFVEYGGGDMIGSFTDIIAALTGDEVADKQMHDALSGGDLNAIGSHGFGYFTQRQGWGGSGRRNHNGRNHSAMYGRRAEIWAELFQFWAGEGGKTKNRDMWKFAQKLLPQTTSTMVNALNKAQTVKLQGSYYNKHKSINVYTYEGKNKPFDRKQQSETNPRTIETTLITRPEDIKPDTIMYHLTNSKNVGNILKYGLTSGNRAINSRYWGSTGTSKASKIFAWTDFNAAQRYSTRSRWNEDLTIIAFKSGNQTWEKDTREMHDQTAFKTPRKKKGSKPAHIPPKNIISYRKIDRGDTLNVMLRGDAQARGGGLFTREVNEGKIPSWKNVKPRTTF